MTGDLTGKVTTVVDMADYLALEAERDEARAQRDLAKRVALTHQTERDRLRDEILRRGWWREAGAPCALCGYDGPGYYQPDTHDCARLAAALEGRDA